MEGSRQRRSSVSGGVTAECAGNRKVIGSAPSLKPLLRNWHERESHAQGGVDAQQTVRICWEK